MLAKMMDTPYDVSRAILRHGEGVDILPANIELSGVEVTMVNAMSREKILKQTLEPLKEKYDHILLDCMPSLSMLTVNAAGSGKQRCDSRTGSISFCERLGAAAWHDCEGAQAD